MTLSIQIFTAGNGRIILVSLRSKWHASLLRFYWTMHLPYQTPVLIRHWTLSVQSKLLRLDLHIIVWSYRCFVSWVRYYGTTADLHAVKTEAHCLTCTSNEKPETSMQGMQKVSTKTALTMIPAQCGVSLARSEGLMASIRKATTVTATPRSSCDRATSRGKRHTLHLRSSSAAALSSFLFPPSLCSEESFLPMSPNLYLSVLSTFFGTVRKRPSLAAGSPSASRPHLLFPSLPRPHLTIAAIWKQRRRWTNMENIWNGFLERLRCHI